MAIITAVLIIFLLAIFQVNPAAINGSFFMGKSEARVLGEMESVDNKEAERESVEIQLPSNKNKEVIMPLKKLEAEEAEEISASSALIMDSRSGKILYQKNIKNISSIASITKLMTALVVLEEEPDLASEYEIREEDRREGGRIYLYQGDRVTVRDLLYSSLVGSANTGTIALVHAVGNEEKEFVEKMNSKAREMGLENTKFADPIGLSSYNVSTAAELVKILEAALEHPEIKEAASLKKYIFHTIQGRRKIVESTDNLLKEKNGFKIIGGKTGYLVSAGFCFVGKFKNNQEVELISVILGTKSDEARFEETKKIVEWAYESYFWPPETISFNN